MPALLRIDEVVRRSDDAIASTLSPEAASSRNRLISSTDQLFDGVLDPQLTARGLTANDIDTPTIDNATAITSRRVDESTPYR